MPADRAARRAFEAYHASFAAPGLGGRDVPSWDAQPDATQRAWRAAASAAVAPVVAAPLELPPGRVYRMGGDR